MKVADVKLSWKKSVSADVASVQIVVVNDGVTTTTDLGPEIEEFMVEVKASKSLSYSIVTKDSEGLIGTSETYSFTLGDLEAPQPATNLFHEVVAVRDVPDEPSPTA